MYNNNVMEWTLLHFSGVLMLRKYDRIMFAPKPYTKCKQTFGIVSSSQTCLKSNLVSY